MIDQDSDKIDEILKEIRKSGLIGISNKTDKEKFRIIQKAHTLNLLEKTPQEEFNFSKHGQEVFDHYGGYKNYLLSKEKEQEKDDYIKDLTIKQLKGHIFQLKYWWLLLLFSGIIGFITGNFELIQEWLQGWFE